MPLARKASNEDKEDGGEKEMGEDSLANDFNKPAVIIRWRWCN